MNQPTEQTSLAMGTFISQKVYGERAQEATTAAIDKIKHLEQLWNMFDPASEVSKLNQASGQAFHASAETIAVLKKSLALARLTNGAYDPTIAPLSKLWKEKLANHSQPSADEIAALLPYVNYQRVNIDEHTASVSLGQGQQIDLGGIAKGYAADRIREIYRDHGISSAYVNLGGNVVTMGNKPDGTPWRVGIQHPRQARSETIAVVEVSNQAVITAGDYEQFSDDNGHRLHHILNPKTGYPSNGDVISATIVGKDATSADAISTALFNLDPQARLELIQQQGLAVVLVTNDHNVYLSKTLLPSFTLNDRAYFVIRL
jgi:thiamine biosynthesis lipoprotein